MGPSHLEEGQRRVGRWQIPIHGESIKPVTAEPARRALGVENIYERIAITHLLTDQNDSGRIAGAIGFAVRENRFYVFRVAAASTATDGLPELALFGAEPGIRMGSPAYGLALNGREAKTHDVAILQLQYGKSSRTTPLTFLENRRRANS